MMFRCSSLAMAIALAAASAASCQKQQAPAGGAAPAAPAAPLPGAAPGPTGNATITGTVKLNGAPPEMRPIKSGSDPSCPQSMKEQEVLIGPGGGLKNAVVRVTGGLTGAYPSPPTPAVVDQMGCSYVPRIQVIAEGQNLLIKNSDRTLHNIHANEGKGGRTMFNVALMQNAPPVTKGVGGVPVVWLHYDVHPWMTAYAVVASNPFSAVTGDDGGFKLTGLPPGTYTVEAWHERYGTKTAQVTVTAEKPAAATLQFEAL